MGAYSVLHWAIVAVVLGGIVVPFYLYSRRFRSSSARPKSATPSAHVAGGAPDDKPEPPGIAQGAADWTSHEAAQAQSTVVNSIRKKGISVDRYVRLVRNRRRFMRFYQVIAFLIFAFVVLVISSEAQLPHGHVDRALPIMTIIMYALLALVMQIGALAFRNRALRILLLRPFDESRLTPALKRVVLKNLGPNGFVFTLADRYYKPNLFARIGEILQNGPGLILYLLVVYVFGTFLHNSKRLRSVSSKFGYRALVSDLNAKVRLNYWSLLSGDAAFNIRTANDWWQTCVHLLMNSCETVVIDLSKVKHGMVWELQRLQTLGMLGKCIFLVSEANAAQTAETLAAHFASGRLPPIHVYASNGKIRDRRRFDEQLRQIMTAGLAGDRLA